MSYSPDEKARADAVRRALGGSTDVESSNVLEEHSKGALYYVIFASIAVIVALAVYYVAGGDRGAQPETLAYEVNPAKKAPTVVPVAALAPKEVPPPVPVVVRQAPVIAKAPAPAPAPSRPRVATPTVRPSQPAPAPVPTPAENTPDPLPRHRAVAISQVYKEGGSPGRVEAPEPVPGWTGRYRTSGEATFWKMSGSTPKPKAFEVLTEEKDGEVVAVDFTIKW